MQESKKFEELNGLDRLNGLNGLNAFEKRKGVGFIGTLLIVFIVLKVTDVIACSWLWVFSPLWIPLALLVAMLTVAVLIALFLAIFENE